MYGSFSGTGLLGPTDGLGRYALRGNLTVNAGAELTVQPGVKLVFNASQSNLSVGLYIYGTFVANNVDFSTAMGSGDIRVYDQGSADFIGCAFSGVIPINFYASSQGIIENSAGIYSLYIYSSSVYISHCTIKGGTYGIYVSDASPRILYNVITQNTYGVYVTGYSCPIVAYNEIYNNSQYGIYNVGTCSVAGVYNWWGDSSGPNCVDNPDGTGNAIYGDINYNGWIGLDVDNNVVFGLDNYSPKSSDPVNTATGNFVFENDDLFIEGIGLNLIFTRYYNSQSGTDGPLGFGWSHKFNLSVSVDEDGIATVQYSDGHNQEFQPNNEGGFISPQGSHDTLVNNNDGTYSLKTQNDLTYLIDDSIGNLVSITDRNGNTISLVYDASGDLDSVTDTMGRVVDVTCNINHKITQLIDPIGRTITYEYDGNGDLVSATDARGNIERYAYDGEHQLLTVQDKGGHDKLTMTYDAENRVVNSQSDANGSVTTYVYDRENMVTTVTDPAGNEYLQYFDKGYRLIKETDPLGNSAKYTYDLKGNRTSVTDKRGKTTTYVIDDRGNVLEKTGPNGNTITAEYNSFNLPLKKIDETGNTTTFTYGANGNLLEILNSLEQSVKYTYNTAGQKLTETDPMSNIQKWEYTIDGYLARYINGESEITTYSFDGVNRLLSVTNPLGNSTLYTYDENNNLLTETNALNATITNTYDVADNLRTVTNSFGEIITYGYSLKNQITTVTSPAGSVVTTTFDNLDRKETVTDPLGNVTRFEYDQIGNLLRLIDPLGNTTHFQYDENGRKVQMTDAEGRITGYAYDDEGLLLSVTDPLENISSAEYDTRGNLVCITDVKGQSRTYAYDELNRITKETDPLGSSTTFTYDANGNLSSRLDPNGSLLTISYDGVNRPVLKDFNNSDSIAYVYDDAGNLLTMTDWLGTTTYTYDPVGHVISVTDTYGKIVQYQFDSAGRKSALIYPGNLRVEYAYNAEGQLASVEDWFGTTTSFGYDEAGRLVSQMNGNGTVTSWIHDAASRITELSNKTSSGSIISQHNFTLDGTGNRTSVSDDVPLTPSFDSFSINFSHNTGHQVVSDGQSTFSYDANGNRVIMDDGITPVSLNYNQMNRLTQVTDGNFNHSYIYNGNGDRLSSIIDGTETRYVLDVTAGMADVLAETDSAGNISRYYIHANGLLYSIDKADNIAHFYHFDGLGSTIALTDAYEAITDSYTYGPYGSDFGETGSTDNQLRYIGKYGVFTEPNDLLFMRARFYDLNTRTFVGKDFIRGGIEDGQTLGPYQYAQNSPTYYSDPEGEWVHIAVGAVVGGVIGGVAYTATHWGEVDGWELTGAIVGGAATGALITAAPVCAPALVQSGWGVAAVGAVSAGTGSAIEKGVSKGINPNDEFDSEDAIDIAFDTAIGGAVAFGAAKYVKQVPGAKPQKYITDLIGKHAQHEYMQTALDLSITNAARKSFNLGRLLRDKYFVPGIASLSTADIGAVPYYNSGKI